MNQLFPDYIDRYVVIRKQWRVTTGYAIFGAVWTDRLNEIAESVGVPTLDEREGAGRFENEVFNDIINRIRFPEFLRRIGEDDDVEVYEDLRLVVRPDGDGGSEWSFQVMEGGYWTDPGEESALRNLTRVSKLNPSTASREELAREEEAMLQGVGVYCVSPTMVDMWKW